MKDPDIHISFHRFPRDSPRRTMLFTSRWGESEIELSPREPWTKPHFIEWGPSWHAFSIGKFEIDWNPNGV